MARFRPISSYDSKGMRIQIASDLHLETRPKMTFRELLDPGVAPILALLGDIAPLNHPNLNPFLEWCSGRWDTVIWIPGCLELLGPGSGNEHVNVPDLSSAVEKMRQIAEPYWNIEILDHDGMVSEDGVYIFGLPFWKFPRDGVPIWHPQKWAYVEAEASPMDPDTMRAIYNRDIAWLQSKVSSQNEPVVILSHFGPTTWLQEQGFIGDPITSMVLPDIEQILRKPIVGWICGHTHQSVQTSKEWSDATGSKGSIFMATNPKGLPFENMEFRKEAVVRIDPSLYG